MRRAGNDGTELINKLEHVVKANCNVPSIFGVEQSMQPLATVPWNPAKYGQRGMKMGTVVLLWPTPRLNREGSTGTAFVCGVFSTSRAWMLISVYYFTLLVCIWSPLLETSRLPYAAVLCPFSVPIQRGDLCKQTRLKRPCSGPKLVSFKPC